MKARSFFLALAAALVVLFSLAAGFWWTMARQSPLRLAEQHLALPRAARFVPRESALSLHWLVDPARLPAYAQAVAPVRHRRDARDSVQQLRDGAFALAGLAFEDELADWIGPQVSLALLEATPESARMGWVLALSSRDQDGARRFLQRFWQTRSLAGTDLQISRYRGMGVISGRGALLGQDPQPLATALIDDDLLLVASGRGVLEQALDVSQIDELHQFGDQDLERRMAQLGDGVALVTASPRALSTWLGLPASLAEHPDLEGLVAALGVRGPSLTVDGMLRFRSPVLPQSRSEGHSLLAGAGGDADVLAALSNPAALLDASEQDPLADWLRPVLRAALDALDAPALDALTQQTDGPLLWEQQPQGWLLATRSDRPGPDPVDAALQTQGLVRSSLDGDRGPLTVWTRLQRQRSRGTDGLQAQLAVALARDSGADWWGETLDALQRRRDGQAAQPRLHQLEDLNAGEPALAQQLALAAVSSRAQLQRWRPWTLIQTVAGQSLMGPVQGLALGVGPAPSSDIPTDPEQAGASDTLRLRALLDLG